MHVVKVKGEVVVCNGCTLGCDFFSLQQAGVQVGKLANESEMGEKKDLLVW